MSLFDLTLLLALVALTLIILAGLVSPYYGKINMLIDKRKLDNAVIIAVVAFAIVMAIRFVYS